MKLTERQRIVFVKVVRAQLRNDYRWYRAADSSERVVLANLYRKSLLDRRTQIGDVAAHEYRLHWRVLDFISEGALEAIAKAGS